MASVAIQQRHQPLQHREIGKRKLKRGRRPVRPRSKRRPHEYANPRPPRFGCGYAIPLPPGHQAISLRGAKGWEAEGIQEATSVAHGHRRLRLTPKSCPRATQTEQRESAGVTKPVGARASRTRRRAGCIRPPVGAPAALTGRVLSYPPRVDSEPQTSGDPGSLGTPGGQGKGNAQGEG